MSILLLDSGSYEYEPRDLVTPEDDFDTLTIYPCIATSSQSTAMGTYSLGATLSGYGDMHVVHREFRETLCGSGRFRGKVTFKGIYEASRPVRSFMDSQGDRSSYQAVASPSSGGVSAPHDISLPRLAVTVRYLADGRPDESDIGTNQTPPAPPDGAWVPPDNPFSSATDVIFSYPDGWVLEKRSGPNIPGTGKWLIEDHYVFYQDWRPNG